MKDFYIHITDIAIEKLKQKLLARKTPNAYIRIGVRGGGCNGFKYVIQIEDTPPRDDKDISIYYYGIYINIDIKSATFLNKSILDWNNSLAEQGFKFINPSAKKLCGCGKSFAI